mmetsp:Transcript_66415/g.156803  ORF Transcript_66415/g.156803 Transcript_66415/m.156803 type:complete len:271 (-) Transcript_66415:27-839(-)
MTPFSSFSTPRRLELGRRQKFLSSPWFESELQTCLVKMPVSCTASPCASVQKAALIHELLKYTALRSTRSNIARRLPSASRQFRASSLRQDLPQSLPWLTTRRSIESLLRGSLRTQASGYPRGCGGPVPSACFRLCEPRALSSWRATTNWAAFTRKLWAGRWRERTVLLRTRSVSSTCSPTSVMSMSRLTGSLRTLTPRAPRRERRQRMRLWVRRPRCLEPLQRLRCLARLQRRHCREPDQQPLSEAHPAAPRPVAPHDLGSNSNVNCLS